MLARIFETPRHYENVDLDCLKIWAFVAFVSLCVVAVLVVPTRETVLDHDGDSHYRLSELDDRIDALSMLVDNGDVEGTHPTVGRTVALLLQRKLDLLRWLHAPEAGPAGRRPGSD